MTSLQKFPKNEGDLGKLNVAKGFKKLPKIQKIAKSGHTATYLRFMNDEAGSPQIDVHTTELDWPKY